MKQSRSELKRQAILNAAKSVFKEHGVQGTSMDTLAKVADVSKKTIYNHFESKEVLVMHLVTELWQNAMVENQYTYDSSEPLAKQLAQLVSQEIALLSSQEYIDLSRVAVGHFFYNQNALQEEIAKISKQETSIYKWIELAVKDGRLAIDNILLANEQLHHLIKGSAFWPQLMGMRETLSASEKTVLIEESVKLFLCRYTSQ